jgi:hypothetical protein
VRCKNSLGPFSQKQLVTVQKPYGYTGEYIKTEGLCLFLLSHNHIKHGFCSVEEIAELKNGPTGCGELARGGCSFVRNCIVTRSTVLT